MKRFPFPASLTVALLGVSVSGGASAQSTWDWGAACDPVTCVVGGITATVSGYGAETSTSVFLPGGVNDVDPSGLGIKSKDGSGSDENITSPNHAIDNFKKNSPNSTSPNGSFGGAAYAELLAINFTEAVRLTEVAVAWTYNDSDAMIFRWDNFGATPDLASTSANLLPTSVGSTAGGWTLVAAGQFATGSLYNGGNIVGSMAAPGSLYSSYWLVSTALGQSSSDANNDGFKVRTFSADVCGAGSKVTDGVCAPTGGQTGSVPEPGSLALAAIAVLGWGASRRKASRSVAL